jgi:hypothetical protein
MREARPDQGAGLATNQQKEYDMSTFHGAQGSGAMRQHREKKRQEASARAAIVLHERTRKHRRGLCTCARSDSTEGRLLGAIFGGAA